VAAPAFDFPGGQADRPTLIVASLLWVAAAGLLVDPWWALVAAGASAVLFGLLRRPRLAGLVTLGSLAFIVAGVVWVVRNEQPFANAAWPIRFERLHGLGLFAAVSLLPAAAGWRARRRAGDPS
jgi:arabinofuranan 3-O-arabinosyltransferase